MIILTSLFTALVAAGAFVKIPMVPVPITLQTLFVFMAALLLPTWNAVAALALYIFLGVIGLPIFTSGGGIAALLGPTGGFIIAFLLTQVPGGLLAKKRHDSFWYNIVVLLVMEVLTYVVGLIWLKTKLDTTWARAFAIGATPFIVGDTLKIIVAAEASKILYPEVQKLAEKLKRREKDE